MVTLISCSSSSIPKLNTIIEVTAAKCFLRLYTFIRIQTCKQITCDRFILWTWSVSATAIRTSRGSQVSVISRIYIKPTHNRLNILLVQCFPGKASKGSTAHPEEPGWAGGALWTPLEGPLPLGCPAESTTDGQLLLGHGQSAQPLLPNM